MNKKTNGPFVLRRLEMMRSPAWRALSGAAKSVIERLEIEHMLHAGKANGRLICTYNDFVEYGIRRMSIAPGIRQGSAFGFVEITQRGRRSPAGGNPTHYRLTYLPTNTCGPTDEWREVKPNRRQSLSFARPPTPRSKPLHQDPKMQIVGSENATDTVAKTIPTSGAKSLLPEQKSSVSETLLPSRIYPSTGEAQGTQDLPDPALSAGTTPDGEHLAQVFQIE
jgi:hypothetical protein